MTEKTSPATQEKKSIWQSNNKFFGAVKEWIRKFVVGLKRRPNNIPLFFIVVTMLIYTLAINDISHTSHILDVPRGGLFMFWTTLISILVCVLYMNAYPKRQKTKTVMLILAVVALAFTIFLDVLYINGINQQLATGIYDSSDYYQTFLVTRIIMFVHICFVAVTIALCATLPLYAKLLNKIDTSIELQQSEMIESASVLEGDIL